MLDVYVMPASEVHCEKRVESGASICRAYGYVSNSELLKVYRLHGVNVGEIILYSCCDLSVIKNTIEIDHIWLFQEMVDYRKGKHS